MRMDTVTDPRSFLEDLYNTFQDEIFTGDPAEVIDRYYAPGFTLVTDGTTIDRERFIQHIRPVRKNVESGRYEVLQAVKDGNRIAARFLIHATHKGKTSRTEVIEFIEMTDDGRFAHVNAVTRTVWE